MPKGYLRDERKQHICDYIRNLAKAKHLTQADLGNIIGVSQGMISLKLKNGDFTLKELLELFKALGADVSKVGELMI